MTKNPCCFFNKKNVFTGLSDCNKLVLLAFKTFFFEEIMYKDFKNFDEKFSNQELRTSLSSDMAVKCTNFENNLLVVSNKHVPLKREST